MYRYAQESELGYLATGQCTNGYCCDENEGCNFVTEKSKLCRRGRDADEVFCGQCKSGFSETTSDVGICKRCKNTGRLTILVFPLFLGIGLIAFFIKQGMKPAEVPHPFIVYMSKSALFVYQLFPFLSFQSTVSIYKPITKFFTIDLDLFTIGGQPDGDCVYEGMGPRTKVMLDMLPAACMLGSLIALEMSMLLGDIYSRKKKYQKNEPWHLGRNNAIWNIIIIVYTQFTAAMIKLSDCRPFGGDGTGIDRALYMYWAGNTTCYDLFHGIQIKYQQKCQ